MTTPEQPRARIGLMVLVAAGCLLLGSTGGAVAGAMITGKDVKDGSLSGKDVKNKSLKTADLDPATVSELHGAAGPPGQTGLPGSANITALNEGGPAAPNSETVLPDFGCPSGTLPLSYDAFWFDFDNYGPIAVTRISGGWHAVVTNNTGASHEFRVRVFCVDLP